MTVNVLIVDDYESYRRALSRLFRANGCSVNEARDYHQATDLISALSLGDGVYDLIVSDYDMPPTRSTGLDLLAHVRLLGPEYAAVPFVLLTGTDSDELRKNVQKLGGIYLLKPAGTQLLLDLIDTIKAQPSPD